MRGSIEWTEHLRTWSFRRHGLVREATEPLPALEQVVGVYSTHPTAPLSLLARVDGLSPDAFAQLDRDRTTARFPAMRGSTHLMPVANAAAINAATGLAPAAFRTRLQGAGIELDDYEAMKPRLLSLLSEPVSASSIKKELGLSAGEFLVIRIMTREALVLRLGTTPRTDRLQYVATAAWLGEPLPKVDRAEALIWLVEAYLRGFGPARAVDIAWWIGAPKGAVATALAAMSVQDLGDGFLLPADLVESFHHVEPIDSTSISILPKWDAYAMGYAPDGRERFVDDDHLRFAYSTVETSAHATSGDGWPIILRGGRAIASWSSRFAGKKLAVAAAPFPGERLDLPEIEPGFAEIAAFMGCDVANVEIASPG